MFKECSRRARVFTTTKKAIQDLRSVRRQIASQSLSILALTKEPRDRVSFKLSMNKFQYLRQFDKYIIRSMSIWTNSSQLQDSYGDSMLKQDMITRSSSIRGLGKQTLMPPKKSNINTLTSKLKTLGEQEKTSTVGGTRSKLYKPTNQDQMRQSFNIDNSSRLSTSQSDHYDGYGSDQFENVYSKPPRPSLQNPN